MHKGFDFFGKSKLKQLRELLAELQVDVVMLQELVGKMPLRSQLAHGFKGEDQLEFLADELWPHSQYGKNAIFPKRHHGNAILSRFPFHQWANFDISQTLLEGRGLLLGCVEVAPGVPLWLANTHLSLFHRDRLIQVQKLRWHLMGAEGLGPIILGGDFNDWNRALSPIFYRTAGYKEAFVQRQGFEAKTFPVFKPLLPLDRIYYRGCECSEAKVLESPWRGISDHLPLFAEFEIPMLSGAHLSQEEPSE